MKAGRELDALVAEKVMGMHKELGTGRGMMGERSGYFDAWIQSNGERYGRNAPPFSTDISVAWQVVEKMKKDGWYFSLNGVAYFRRKGGSGKGVGEQGDKCLTSHAICLAALAAKGIELDIPAPVTS